MTFENISKRKLSFAPKNIVIGDEQKEFKIAPHETNFAYTDRIIAPNKMILFVSNNNPDDFEKLPELTYIEGNLSLQEGCTVIATKLTKIEGDLHVGVRAKFYAPILREVTGFVYLGIGAIVNAPKIEQMFSNDDTSKINAETTPEWLNSL